MVFEPLFGLIDIIQMNSYLFIFLIMIFEGPIVTAVASYAASIGFFNIWIIFLISLFGNFIPDLFFYFIGRFSRTKRTENIVKRFGLNECQILKLEENLKKHFGKTLCVVKLSPMLPIPGIILAGFSRVPFKKFLLIDLLLNLLFSVIFTLFGYYFGFMINTIFNYFRIGQFSIFGIILVVLIVYLVYRKIKSKQKVKC